MGAEVHSHGKHESARIDMTPMVDCVLVLVIFLIVSSAFVQDPGVEVQKPDVRASDVAERNALLIAITADNRIYFDGQEIRIEQVSTLVQKAAFGQELPLISGLTKPVRTACSPPCTPKRNARASLMCNSQPPTPTPVSLWSPCRQAPHNSARPPRPAPSLAGC